MARVTINGVNYSGNNVYIKNGKVVVDGVDCTPDEKKIEILVEGSISELKVDCCDKVMVNGAVGHIKSVSGDVQVLGDVGGDVITTSGDVKCENVSGMVKTLSGDIKYRK